MKWWILSLVVLLASCQSPRASHVGIGKSYPSGNCREVGQVIGTSNSRNDSYNKAVEDLRYAAAARDGDYVRIIAVAAHGASIRGMAYKCR